MNSPFLASSLTNEFAPDVSVDLAITYARLVLPDRTVLGAITIESGASIPMGAVNCGSDLVLQSISVI